MSETDESGTLGSSVSRMYELADGSNPTAGIWVMEI